MLAAGLAVCAALPPLAAATCRPSWYQPAAVDYARLSADRAELARLENRISAAVNAGQAVEIVLDERQVNRWIAARRELWLDAPPELPGVFGLQTAFLSGQGVRVAAGVEHKGWRAVASGVLAVEVMEDELLLRIGTLRLGVLPAPGSLVRPAVEPALRSAVSRIAEYADGDRAGGALRLINDFVWPNGKRRIRVASVVVEDGALRITLEPR